MNQNLVMSNEELKSKLTLNIPTPTDQSLPSGSHSIHTETRSRSNKSSPSVNTKLEMDLNILLKFIKPYDGDREKLNSFLINCNNAYDLANESQKPVLFKFILCQLQGKAEVACSIKNFSSWDQLKEFLKTQFSERKHYSHLLTDLQESKQGLQESVGQFSLRVETYLSQLLTEITLSDTKVKEVPGRVAAMEDLALHHFMMGLLPRISNIVRCRSPKNLNEAINLAVSEERIQQSIYKRNTNENQNTRPRQQNFNNSNPHRSNQYIPNRAPQRQPQQTTNNPSQSQQPALFCRYCKTPGHDISVCRKREYNNNRYKVSQNPGPNQGGYRPSRVNFVTDEGEDVVDNNEIDVSPNDDNDDLN